MTTPTTASTSSLLSSRNDHLQDKVYSSKCFLGTTLREELSSNYFGIADLNQDDLKIPFLQEMISNHRKCPYWRLLKYYCPCILDFPVNKKCKPMKFPKPTTTELLSDHSTMGSLHSFVCSILKRLIPLNFFGNIRNRRTFFKNIKGLLSVQKYGTISLDFLIRDLTISKMSWISDLSHKEQKESVLKCVDFLVTKIICPLIQSFFFSVDSSYAKINLFFFRKRVWHILRHKAFADFSKFCRLNVISENYYKDLLQHGECLGSAKIDFILKKSSLRPISNLSFRENGRACINNQLKSLLVVLNFEKETNKLKFGATAMGKLDFHKKFREFMLKIRNDKFPKLYFVTADVEKCFDSIQPSLLLEISQTLMRFQFYTIYKYKRYYYNSEKKQVLRYFESIHFLTDAQHKYGNVELISHRTVENKSLLKTLKALLTNNVIKMGKHYYLQKKGIAQGSKLSSVLSAAYLSYIETKINMAVGVNDFCVRIEDEYLFISTMKRSAECFLRDLILGLRRFECNININKCAASFNCNLGSPIGEITKCPDMKFFGLSLSSTDYSVSSDYSLYKGLQASDVVTCRLTRNPGRNLQKTVVRSLYHKCDAILFDGAFNSQLVMRRNVLQIFCMTAMKYHFLVMRLPWQNRVDKNPSFFLNIILSLPALLHRYITRVNLKIVTNNISPLPIETINGLCFNAFLYKLGKNKNIYHKILDELKQHVLHSHFVSENVVNEAFDNIFLR